MNIRIIEKPDNITYDNIHELLWAANQENRKNGFNLNTAKLTGSELKQRIGNDGKCFVALDGDKLVGTISFRLVKVDAWYYSGVLPEYMLAGVLPEYQGKHINSRLANCIFEYATENKYPAVSLTVAENSKRAVSIYKHQGFTEVDYKVYLTLDHNNIVMIKWFQQCPYKNIKRKVMFGLRKYYRLLRNRRK